MSKTFNVSMMILKETPDYPIKVGEKIRGRGPVISITKDTDGWFYIDTGGDNLEGINPDRVSYFICEK